MFGSELRAVLAALPERPAVDTTALNLFLRYRYTPSPLTLYEGIRKLAPGTMRSSRTATGAVERWYAAGRTPARPRAPTREATEELLAIYQRALKRHLISRRAGRACCFSGGVDSGLLLGLMNLHGT